ncbi:MAG TPA: hypothetical protein PKC79_18145, partial [Solidesulfovibrio magneticus]|nr:hypothetical protein [Solidesulfovibrio magneticus]
PPAAPPKRPAAAEPKLDRYAHPVTWRGIPQPAYFRDGHFWLPPGIRAATLCKHWYCVCHPDGSYRDALAVLYLMFDQVDMRAAVIDIPALGRRFELAEDWRWDVLCPAMAALRQYAAATLGLSLEVVGQLAYVTQAWKGEERSVLRDVPHLGHVTIRRLPAGSEAAA